MQSYYEKNREDNQSLEYKRSTNHSYPPHFHLNLEIFLLDRGEYEITVNDNKYTVTDGDIVVFDSYDIHSYERKSVPKAGGNDGLLVIPYRYLTRFNGWRKNFRITTPIIRNERLCAELLALADKYLIGETDERVKESALDLLLARLLESLQFSESKTKDEGMLRH
ncbi:MAG: AraC family ligand binding domain-containing protein [Clostridia bacterium]|nr:AraC family ligand binding domain-containing protein [Clostridia bacterium]